jgi:hypothetical protein
MPGSDGAHQQRVAPAAEKARDQTHGHADRGGDRYRAGRRQERCARARDDTGHDVAAEFVGAEPVVTRRAFEGAQQILRERVDRQNGHGERGDGQHHQKRDARRRARMGEHAACDLERAGEVHGLAPCSPAW